MLRKYLSQRYPVVENVWKIIIPISLFVGLFMLIFQPFGLNGLEYSGKYFILAGYGLVTLFVLLFNLLLLPAILPSVFREENWTVLKEILFLLWILFTVGLANLLYSSWTMIFSLTFINILVFQAYTLAVGLLPITALTLVKQSYLKRKNETSADLISRSISDRPTAEPSGSLVEFAPDNARESLQLVVDQILYIKAEGNYIHVAYLKNGKLTRNLLRRTMKEATDLLKPFPFLYQCHRSWMVNLNTINKVSGNSQGLRLLIAGVEEEVPVARNLVGDFRHKVGGIGHRA